MRCCHSKCTDERHASEQGIENDQSKPTPLPSRAVRDDVATYILSTSVVSDYEDDDKGSLHNENMHPGQQLLFHI